MMKVLISTLILFFSPGVFAQSGSHGTVGYFKEKADEAFDGFDQETQSHYQRILRTTFVHSAEPLPLDGAGRPTVGAVARDLHGNVAHSSRSVDLSETLNGYLIRVDLLSREIIVSEHIREELKSLLQDHIFIDYLKERVNQPITSDDLMSAIAAKALAEIDGKLSREAEELFWEVIRIKTSSSPVHKKD